MKPNQRILRIATFQRQPRFDDIAGTIDRLSADIKWCDDQGVHLAVFPECYLQGYSSKQQTIARRGLSFDSQTIKRMLVSLSPFRPTIILGVIERRGVDYYNTAAVIRNGNFVGTYSKSHPNEQGFKAGQNYSVFKVSGWTFGINICNDANFPEEALRISRQGAKLLCFPLNNMLSHATASQWRSRSIENLRQRAIETGCWVVSSDVVGEHDEKISHGCTCVIRPDGQIVQQVAEGIEGTLAFDLI